LTMHLKYESTVREPLVVGHKTYAQVTEDIISPIERKPGRMWYVGFFFSLALLGFVGGLLLVAIGDRALGRRGIPDRLRRSRRLSR